MTRWRWNGRLEYFDKRTGAWTRWNIVFVAGGGGLPMCYRSRFAPPSVRWPEMVKE